MTEAYVELARWRLRRSELEIDITHGAGTKHQDFDVLSRCKTEGEDRKTLDDEAPVFTIFPNYLACVLLTLERKLETI